MVHHLMKDELIYATMESGEPFVGTLGITKMLLLYAVSWDSLQLVIDVAVLCNI